MPTRSKVNVCVSGRSYDFNLKIVVEESFFKFQTRFSHNVIFILLAEGGMTKT